MTNILFSCAGRRAYLLQYFRRQLDIRGGGKIIATDMQSIAPALASADIVEQVPGVFHPNYIEQLLQICRRHSVDAIISLNDLELPILARNKQHFLAVGTLPIISPPNVIDVCADKVLTAQWLTDNGFKTPTTCTSLSQASTMLNSGTLHFPLVVKPRWGSGSIAVEIVHDTDELLYAFQLAKKKVMRSILEHQSAQARDYIIIQQCIDGIEYGIDVINDLHGSNITASVKRKIAMRAGETDKAITVDNPTLRQLAQTIGQKLQHIGNLDIDVFAATDGQYYVLEMNPRFGGGFPFSYEAGVNLPGAIIEWLQGHDAADVNLSARPDVAHAKCDHLVPIHPDTRHDHQNQN
ncbi:MAG: ATP-grasp domain-containing protein [Muribaculaceae bacterium]